MNVDGLRVIVKTLIERRDQRKTLYTGWNYQLHAGPAGIESLALNVAINVGTTNMNKTKFKN
jgi:hypothetical protein